MNTQFDVASRAAGIRLSAFFMAAAAALAPMHSDAISLTLDPASQDVATGGTFSMSLNIAGLGDHTAPSLGTFDFNLRFDPLLVSIDSVSFGDAILGDLLAPVSPSLGGWSLVSPGLLNAFAVSLDKAAELDASQPGAFGLLTFHFTGHHPGNTAFLLEDVILGDALGDSLVLDSAVGAQVNVRGAAVPDSGPGWLGAASMAALVAWRRSAGSRDRGAKG